jgi:hypothetical protein
VNNYHPSRRRQDVTYVTQTSELISAPEIEIDKPLDYRMLTDEQINQARRFRGLPPLDAKEMRTHRGFLRWMQERFAPARRPNNDKPPQS